MSEQSKRIAQQFQAAKRTQDTRDELDVRLLDVRNESFKRLREELQKGFQSLCEELNQEPAIGNILVCDFSGDDWNITRKDSGGILSAKLDSGSRKVIFKCDQPTKFRYSIGVKSEGTNPYFVDGKGTAAPNLEIVIDYALRALLGVGRSA